MAASIGCDILPAVRAPGELLNSIIQTQTLRKNDVYMFITCAPLYRGGAGPGIIITHVCVCGCASATVCPSVRKITHDRVNERRPKSAGTCKG